MSESEVTELSRLRAFVARVAPIVAAAVELRAIGRSLEQCEEWMEERRGTRDGTRSATPWLIIKQGYDTALIEFDQAVKKAALGDFADLLGPTYNLFKAVKSAQAPAHRPS